MRILGLCGSPRKNGNSTTLLKEVIKGAEVNQAESEIIYVSELTNVHQCIHCDNCLKTGKCIFSDDIQKVIDAVSDCDVLVIASPLHFANISSQLKVIIDRMQILWAYKYILKKPLLTIKERKCIFISTATRNDENQFEGSINTIKNFLRCGDIKLENILLFPSVENIGDADLRTDYLKKCYETGIKITEF